MNGPKPDVPWVKAFCLGQAKSGTASLYGLLGTHYRAAHEPERAETLDLVRQVSNGMHDDAVAQGLFARDRRLQLDFDIAWANQFLTQHLVTTFPHARFVVLIREPVSWLNSIVGHLVTRDIPGEVRGFLDWWFKPDQYPPTRHDRGLEAAGVYSVRAFLAAWNTHIETCTRLVPDKRRLILRTDELKTSHARLADFLDVPVAHLDPGQGHLNPSRWSDGLESLVDREYVEEMVRTVCAAHLRRFFPDVTDDGSA